MHLTPRQEVAVPTCSHAPSVVQALAKATRGGSVAPVAALADPHLAHPLWSVPGRIAAVQRALVERAVKVGREEHENSTLHGLHGDFHRSEGSVATAAAAEGLRRVWRVEVREHCADPLPSVLQELAPDVTVGLDRIEVRIEALARLVAPNLRSLLVRARQAGELLDAFDVPWHLGLGQSARGAGAPCALALHVAERVHRLALAHNRRAGKPSVRGIDERVALVIAQEVRDCKDQRVLAVHSDTVAVALAADLQVRLRARLRLCFALEGLTAS
mmetsp:Transcript_2415/g.9608  ORF Transcript_2415/g.9608 Transcript_2415/m.9608 type:complete len:273 (+) Transcript_2415:379-1197(+)